MKIGLLPSEVSIRISEFSKKFLEAIWIELPKYDYSEDKNDKYVCTAPELHTWMSPDSKGYTDLVFNESKYIQDHPEIECSIKYPLNTPCNFKVDLTGNGGFLCITDIILQVCKMYRQIYKEEKET
ncbi:MAG: hypothetical protein IJ880_11175, partial [Bacilli bacterium]|nr:hypothetical protein [Bacilli bacterium]